MYILTHSGKRFNYVNLDPAAVDIHDIAHALSQVNRFTGHSRFASSVAQHCIAASHYLQRRGAPTSVILGGLLHDAHEAYFGDVPSPLKYFLGISPQEKRIQNFVIESLGFAAELVNHPLVKQADLVSLKVERLALLPPDGDESGWEFLNILTEDMMDGMPEPFPSAPATMRDYYLERFFELSERLEHEGPVAA